MLQTVLAQDSCLHDRIFTEGECLKPPTLRAKAQGSERLREELFNLLRGREYLSIAKCHSDCTGRLDPTDFS